jgi:PAS domain S-box-containing protein
MPRTLPHDALIDRYEMISSLISDWAFSYRVFPDRTYQRDWITEASFTQNTGYTAHELDEIGWETLIHPDDRHIIREHIDAMLSRRDDVREFRIITKSGETRWLRSHARPIKDDPPRDDGSVHVVGAAEDITDHKAAELALRLLNDSLEQRVSARTADAAAHARDAASAEEDARVQKRVLQSILDSVGDGIVVADLTGKFLLFNPAAERIVGLGMQQLPMENWSKHYGCFKNDQVTRYPPEELPLARAMRGESIAEEEMFLRNYARPDGVWISISARPLRDEQGNVQGGTVVLHDITQRRADEQRVRDSERRATDLAQRATELAQRATDLAEHNRRLVQEVDHRVRNNLTGLLGWITRMRDKTPSVREFAHAIESRLNAMAHVHQLLADAGWKSVDLVTLLHSTLQTMQHLAPHPADVTIEGPPVALSAKQTLPLAMVLVELFTNSCKHGAHSIAGGCVEIRWSVSPAGASSAGVVHLTWTERNGPPISQPVAHSLGTELITGFITRELHGRCDLSFPREGARHVIEFPLH